MAVGVSLNDSHDFDYRLIVSHSHSCGPAELPGPPSIDPCWPPKAPRPWPMADRCPKLKLLDDMPPGRVDVETDDVRGRAASFEPVDVPPGLSMSILGDISGPLLLCRR